MLENYPKKLKKEMQLKPNQRNLNMINHDEQILKRLNAQESLEMITDSLKLELLVGFRYPHTNTCLIKYPVLTIGHRPPSLAQLPSNKPYDPFVVWKTPTHLRRLASSWSTGNVITCVKLSD